MRKYLLSISYRKVKRLYCNHEEADTKILFHFGHPVAPNNVVVRTADTDVLTIALANMKKVPADINVWLKMGLHTNSTLRCVNVNKLDQALGNSLYVAMPAVLQLLHLIIKAKRRNSTSEIT